ncbi:hypothetical protein CYMTET_19503 [Cymbomonas tetramitiformis]|uniref:P-type ATPase A domain-containing protein n=1 Tax=Cymbomonas tetramitiformis TaxID=36881 RepID=A0AAE0L559_9CHLO|nr:hypothetical protein CYMTET_19503 [Cymbomonas tetramitiformis]
MQTILHSELDEVTILTETLDEAHDGYAHHGAVAKEVLAALRPFYGSIQPGKALLKEDDSNWLVRTGNSNFHSCSLGDLQATFGLAPNHFCTGVPKTEVERLRATHGRNELTPPPVGVVTKLLRRVGLARTPSAQPSFVESRMQVLRDGCICSIEIAELVVGDIMRAYAGSNVPADGRVLVMADDTGTVCGGDEVCCRSLSGLDRLQQLFHWRE